MACKSCNSGWMANLDNKVLRIISPMILGARTGVLTVEAQVVIATWAVKTAMVSEFLNPGAHYFTADGRRKLMDNRFPPSGVHVWVGFYGVMGHRGIQGAAATHESHASAGNIIAHTLTLAVGNLSCRCFRSEIALAHHGTYSTELDRGTSPFGVFGLLVYECSHLRPFCRKETFTSCKTDLSPQACRYRHLNARTISEGTILEVG